MNVAVTPRILSTVENAMDLTSFDFDVTVGSIIKARLGGTLRIRCPAEGLSYYIVLFKNIIYQQGDPSLSYELHIQILVFGASGR